MNEIETLAGAFLGITAEASLKGGNGLSCRHSLAGRIPRHHCRGLVEGSTPHTTTDEASPAFLGITAEASLKGKLGDRDIIGIDAAFLGITAEASLKEFHNNTGQYGCHRAFLGITAEASLKAGRT